MSGITQDISAICYCKKKSEKKLDVFIDFY